MPDYPKFCTSCGASLESGQKFCISCGAPVQAGSSNEDSSVSVHNQKTVASSYNPGDTSPMPVINAAQPGYTSGDTQVFSTIDSSTRQYRQPGSTSPVNLSASSQDSKKKVLIAVVAVLAVAVCISIGVLFGVVSNSQANSQQPSDSVSEKTEQPTTSDAAASSSQPESTQSSASGLGNTVSASDKELYSTLSGYYSRLGSYDSKISSAAKDFNANYMSKNMSTRSSCAESATTLQEDIANEYEALKNLSIPSNSSYASTYSAMLTCYYDCSQRIGAIVESWNNSLRYSDPTGHSDEICEPLSRDKSGNNNKYYTDFKQVYPTAKPEAPND